MKILINHVGYETDAPKRAVLQASEAEACALEARAHRQAALACRVVDAASGEEAWQGQASYLGAVERWRDRVFWSLDFSDLRIEGRYLLVASAAAGAGAELASEPFEVGPLLVLCRTGPAVMQYFRSQRCIGSLDRADRRTPFHGGRPGRVDVHGGWYDASGDPGKYLSHLSHANFMNPQQTPLVVWSFLAARDLLERLPAGTGVPEAKLLGALRSQLLVEALYGADFLARMQDPAGYFYTSVFDGWSGDPARREICSFRTQAGIRSDRYRAGFRQGGGMAVAALARAAGAATAARRTAGAAGAGTGSRWARGYREAAERGFAHLEENNLGYLDDGRENIIDDYCALLGAVELYGSGGRPEHLSAARLRAERLGARLCTDGRYRDWWRAGDSDERPYFHAVEAGLPVIALLRYAGAEPEAGRAAGALETALRSLRFEMALTDEVTNPFGYARQYVKPVHGARRSSFFIPHDNDTGYWWQGENARLASLAVAARLALLAARTAAPGGTAEAGLARRLPGYAADQLNWILGLNPFDTCMLHGFGRNNPEYESAHPNAFGGICNGITAGIEDEDDIDFLPGPYAERGEHRWRWSEQWLPHAAWYLLALCAGAAAGIAA